MRLWWCWHCHVYSYSFCIVICGVWMFALYGIRSSTVYIYIYIVDWKYLEFKMLRHKKFSNCFHFQKANWHFQFTGQVSISSSSCNSPWFCTLDIIRDGFSKIIYFKIYWSSNLIWCYGNRFLQLHVIFSLIVFSSTITKH